MRVVPVLTEKEGGCNFCTGIASVAKYVWQVSSSNPNRNLVLRICDNCMTEIRAATKQNINLTRAK